jgi:D-alanyl-D-alanine carboxypeptidase (penicillin-binding protein 5/6)
MNEMNPFLLVLGMVVLFVAGRNDAVATSPTSKNLKTPPPKPGIAQSPYLGAVVVDAASGRVLFADKPDAKGYPASVLKLMDLLLIQEKIQQKQLSLQDQVIVSAKASKTGGSQVWLAEKEVFTVDDLLYALMVQSANDVAVALAERVAGTTEGFVELMNKRARELGMNNTVFHSVHGLPPGIGQQPDVTTARDFAILCRELLKYKDTLRYTSTRERPFRPNGGPKLVMMRTHNHLLGQVEGCDGFKTGYFTIAGFSVAVTVERGGQRIIAIVLGSLDRKVRDAKAAELVSKGFAALPPMPANTPQLMPSNAKTSTRPPK